MEVLLPVPTGAQEGQTEPDTILHGGFGHL